MRVSIHAYSYALLRGKGFGEDKKGSICLKEPFKIQRKNTKQINYF